MRNRTIIGFGFLLLAAVLIPTLPAQARDPGQQSYIPNNSVDGEALIGPPPAAGSAEFQRDMTVVLWLQRTRTPAQVRFVEKPLNLARFAPILGARLLKVDGVRLQRTLDAVIDETRAIYDALKAKYGKPRPFQVSKAVKPVGDARPVATYPSGHAIRAIVYARLLAVIFPDRKPALMALGRQIGYGRVIAGVHYPSDVLAGQKLGNALADAVSNSSAFKAALSRIRQTERR